MIHFIQGTCSHVTGYPDSAERQLFNELNKVPRIGYKQLKKSNRLKFLCQNL